MSKKQSSFDDEEEISGSELSSDCDDISNVDIDFVAIGTYTKRDWYNHVKEHVEEQGFTIEHWKKHKKTWSRFRCDCGW